MDMASVSSPKIILENITEDEEFEHFDDFTLASSWERFISEIEAVCRQWLDDDQKNLLVKDVVQTDLNTGLYKVKSEFKYATKNYYMEYHFDTNNDGEVGDWNKALNDLQLCFGVKNFVVVAPQSRTGVVLDAPEASKLLSAVAIALSNCSCLWPAFVPVHDTSRKAYIGIQSMGTVFTRRFEADCIGSQIPAKFMHLEGLYELFVSKFAYAATDVSMHHFKVQFKMKITYRTPKYDDGDNLQEDEVDITSGENFESDANVKMQWDDDCPWSEWYTAEDPIKEFMLVAIWPNITAESSMDMVELENASPLEADKWFLYPNLGHNLGVTDGNTIGFASQLCLLVEALEISLDAQFMEDFVSVGKFDSANLNYPAIIPPPIVLDRVLKDLFHEVGEVQMGSSLSENKCSIAIKGAPLDSLFAQCSLHALWFGNCNIRAIAVLWIEFVREVRWCWEESQPLPQMRVTGTIDLSTCLIHQKLHMLAICIHRKRIHGEGYNISGHDDSARTEENQVSEGFSASQGVEGFGSNNGRKRLALTATSMMLLKACKFMYAPVIQDPPPMTEDMHEERIQAAQVLGDSYTFSGQLEKDILASDMSAFKAANPDSVFEDFIRWHSPKDWENENKDATEGSHVNSRDALQVEWPPRGRLSERMSGPGNSWRKIWNEAPPLPASEQKPLFDPIREGEKALHYLETLRPQQLLEQMVCTAFCAAADTLNQTSFGGFKQMTEKMGQLYITIASVLKYMQSYNATHDPDVIENLKQLCVTFEHVEKLLILAASLHQKFLQAPHLGEAIFNDYYDYYLPKMRKVHVQGDVEQEFDKMLEIESQDRNVVAHMFIPENAANSLTNDSRMGNLLNGSEPISRELIFSKRDQVSGSYYASASPTVYQQEIETCRMYVRGTPDDLHVALSVASSD